MLSATDLAKIIETKPGVRSKLISYLEQNGVGTPNRFADNPGFPCLDELKEELTKTFTFGQKFATSEIAEGDWIARLKLQIQAEAAAGTITSVEAGDQRIKKLYAIFETNVTNEAKALLECTKPGSMKAKLKEIINNSFPKLSDSLEAKSSANTDTTSSAASLVVTESKATVTKTILANLAEKTVPTMKEPLAVRTSPSALSESESKRLIADFFNHPAIKIAMEQVMGIKPEAFIAKIGTVLSMLADSNPFIGLVIAVVKSLKGYQPTEETLPHVVVIGKALYDACDNVSKVNTSQESSIIQDNIINLVSLLRGIKNEHKSGISLFKSEGCKRFARSLKDVLTSEFPGYTKVKQTKPDGKTLERIKSLSQQESPKQVATLVAVAG